MICVRPIRKEDKIPYLIVPGMQHWKRRQIPGRHVDSHSAQSEGVQSDTAHPMVHIMQIGWIQILVVEHLRLDLTHVL